MSLNGINHSTHILLLNRIWFKRKFDFDTIVLKNWHCVQNKWDNKTNRTLKINYKVMLSFSSIVLKYLLNLMYILLLRIPIQPYFHKYCINILSRWTIILFHFNRRTKNSCDFGIGRKDRMNWRNTDSKELIITTQQLFYPFCNEIQPW